MIRLDSPVLLQTLPYLIGVHLRPVLCLPAAMKAEFWAGPGPRSPVTIVGSRSIGGRCQLVPPRHS